MSQDYERRVPYPPAPWRSSGRLWMGFFKTDVPVQLPSGLKPFLNPRWLVVTLVRYLEGTLRYDELAVGPLARLGARFGIFVPYIWVDSEASMWGGRRIWGVPKEMAVFAWEGDTVSVTDKDGLIAALTVDTQEARLPKIWMPAPGLGRVDEQWAFTIATMSARLGRSGMHIAEWSPRFPYRPGEKPMFGLGAKPFWMTVPKPRLVDVKRET